MAAFFLGLVLTSFINSFSSVLAYPRPQQRSLMLQPESQNSNLPGFAESAAVGINSGKPHGGLWRVVPRQSRDHQRISIQG